MAWTKNILVLSARTVGSDVLLEHMRRCAANGPTQSSRWLAIDLPYRVQRLTDALVTHVIAEASTRDRAISARGAAQAI